MLQPGMHFSQCRTDMLRVLVEFPAPIFGCGLQCFFKSLEGALLSLVARLDYRQRVGLIGCGAPPSFGRRSRQDGTVWPLTRIGQFTFDRISGHLAILSHLFKEMSHIGFADERLGSSP